MAIDQREATLRILASLHAITRTLKRRAQAQHGDSLALLTVLSAVAVPGGIRASEVADQLLVDLSSVSRRISTLEAKGLVEKVVDSCDRRASLVALTPSGHELLQSLRENAGDRMSTVLAHWSARDLDQLVRLLTRFEADLASAEDHQTTTAPALSTR
jgi:DNA-binding MarR family transcriptional regulator